MYHLSGAFRCSEELHHTHFCGGRGLYRLKALEGAFDGLADKVVCCQREMSGKSQAFLTSCSLSSLCNGSTGIDVGSLLVLTRGCSKQTVPFLLVSGKQLRRRRAHVDLHFRRSAETVCLHEECEPRTITFNIQV